MLSIGCLPRILDGLFSRPFEVCDIPASSLASLSGAEVRWGVVRPALATAMAGYCKGDPRLGLAGSPVLELSNNERNALGIPPEGCCSRISVYAWLTLCSGIAWRVPSTRRITATGYIFLPPVVLQVGLFSLYKSHFTPPSEASEVWKLTAIRGTQL